MTPSASLATTVPQIRQAFDAHGTLRLNGGEGEKVSHKPFLQGTGGRRAYGGNGNSPVTNNSLPPADKNEHLALWLVHYSTHCTSVQCTYIRSCVRKGLGLAWRSCYYYELHALNSPLLIAPESVYSIAVFKFLWQLNYHVLRPLNCRLPRLKSFDCNCDRYPCQLAIPITMALSEEEAEIVVLWVLTGGAIAIMLLRLALKQYRKQGLSLGDYFTIAAIVAISLRGAVIHVAIVWGTNSITAAARKTMDFTPQLIYRLEVGSKLTIVNRVFYTV